MYDYRMVIICGRSLLLARWDIIVNENKTTPCGKNMLYLNVNSHSPANLLSLVTNSAMTIILICFLTQNRRKNVQLWPTTRLHTLAFVYMYAQIL